MKTRIVAFKWDHSKYEDNNGASLIIGQLLPNYTDPLLQNPAVELYGMSMDISNDRKDFQLKRLSLYADNIDQDFGINEISKDEARKLYHEEIEKILNLIYDEGEYRAANDKFNIEHEEAFEED